LYLVFPGTSEKQGTISDKQLEDGCKKTQKLQQTMVSTNIDGKLNRTKRFYITFKNLNFIFFIPEKKKHVISLLKLHDSCT
jgi:hypothetical protein